jgi:hypothetical protein
MFSICPVAERFLCGHNTVVGVKRRVFSAVSVSGKAVTSSDTLALRLRGREKTRVRPHSVLLRASLSVTPQ